MEPLGYAVEVDELGSVVGTLDAGPGPCVLYDGSTSRTPGPAATRR